MNARKESDDVLIAIDILKSKEPVRSKTLLDLSANLKKQNAFNYARQILRRARLNHEELTLNKELAYKIEQQYALCIYKDQDLTLDFRLDLALKILKAEVLDIENSKDPETLGYAGAIYKRKWEAVGEKNALIASLYYYRKGHDLENGQKDGYPGINAAFIADYLAKLEEGDSQFSSVSNTEAIKAYRKVALNIRSQLVTNLTSGLKNGSIESNWWVLVTLTEAYFGMGRYDEAQNYLKQALVQENIARWEYETTTHQLAKLAILQTDNIAEIMTGSAGAVIKLLSGVDGNADAILETAVTGKIGLALSGGGFRAALFHIGLLAKLAELDILRRVEVISCVSGGSIVGACYYLALKQKLELTTDANMTNAVYVGIVRELETEFLKGVQLNLRVRIVTNWWANIKMMILPGYTRTLRLGELYEKKLFKAFSGKEKHLVTDLIIRPFGESEDFKPKYNNWYRKAKVPILIINATTLNTGHNWQFTGSWMGEPPFGISSIDGNFRLRRLYYDQSSAKEPIRLGYAVAASSCVPALFPPVQLNDVYPKLKVKLVDGGVHDNQGTSSLIEQGCTVLLVSDSSGQMNSENNPSSSFLSVTMRSNDILMERVRNAQYQDLQMRLRNKLVRGLMFIHLKADLDVKSINWIGAPPEFPLPVYGADTDYQVEKDFQSLLAGVRTDLDSFHNVEAYALMKDAYQMSDYELTKSKVNVLVATTKPFVPVATPWLFNNPLLPLKIPTKKMNRLLLVSASKLLKVFKLKPLAATLLAFLVLGIPVGFIKLILDNWVDIHDPLLKLVTWLGGGFLVGITAFTLMMNLYVHLLDRLYKAEGK